ncbi:MAG: LacI family transcriptional regulator [Chloroflexi bacterium]|nr:MAG: LacI family transcriptional regulator [Chloroflexota bacterium]
MHVTQKDIARKLGISITTVSRALAGYSDVAEETRQRVLQTAQEMGYSPHLLARRLQKQRTDTIGFIMPTLAPRFSDPFFSEFIAGVGNEAASHEYDLLVSTHPPESESEMKAYERAAKGGWVDGLIIVRTREKDERIRLLCQYKFPFVSFGRTNESLDFAYVDEDGETGIKLLTQHLIDLGHRRIGFIRPPKDMMAGHFRLQGFMKAMAENDLPVRPEWIVEGDMTQRGGEQSMAVLLDVQPGITAVIAGNDLMAIGAMHCAQQRGLEVGKDISVAGFDDIPLAAYVKPSLTTLRQPIYEIGRMTCRMLIDLINGRFSHPPQVLLVPQLIIRSSTAPPASD